MSDTIWNSLGTIAIISLILFFFVSERNAVWGGLTIGAVIGFIVSLFFNIDLSIVVKGATIGTLTGAVAEGLAILSKILSHKKVDEEIYKTCPHCGNYGSLYANDHVNRKGTIEIIHDESKRRKSIFYMRCDKCDKMFSYDLISGKTSKK
jgi:uncharacterized C2H2 Zn-finger protein